MSGKGKKRSAEVAFPSKAESFRTSLKQHRVQVSRNGAKGKIVDFEVGSKGKVDGNGDGDEVGPQASNKVSNLKDRARRLLSFRQQLPIYSHADEIRRRLREHDVLLLIGETGSGKSTQIPQFLVNEPWCKKRKCKEVASVGGCIAITQPRRVAAISLARRVAEEMGTPLGNSSPASQVGYSVRFDNSTGPSTRIKFLTEGMLLQEMLRDPWLREYSAVVVDEVHERGVNVDLALGFLKRMQGLRDEKDGRGGSPLKVVIMSATADMERISDFFNPQQSTDGSAPIASATFRPSGEELSGSSDQAHVPKAGNGVLKAPAKTSNPSDLPGTERTSGATSLFIKGRQYPVTIHYTPTPVPDMLDAAYQRIMYIHTHSPLPGDILVFLTGQESVESLHSLVNSWSISILKDPKQSKTLPKLLTLPLYAALPSNLQQRVFQTTPKFTRKIILATNIAETSITVPGIRYVIDTGKAKQRLFRPSLNLDTLLTVPISRSSANQRSGRAGRDAAGQAYRLYTESDFYQLSQDTEPEILRCDLSQLLLTLKAHGVDDLQSFPFLTPPPRRALERAIVHLLQLSALDKATGQITPLGREMSVLPLPVSLARVLLASAEPEYDCVEEIVDVVSALSVENIFLNIHHDRQKASSASGDPLRQTSKSTVDNESDSGEESNSVQSLAQQARRALFRREGDHLTLLATVQAYASENTDRRRWCEERFISHRAMSGAMDVRKQLTSLMARYKNKNKAKNGGRVSGINEKTFHNRDRATLPARILKCLLTGFHTNVARLSNDGSYRTLITNQAVAIHPSSVLFLPPGSSSRDSQSSGGQDPRQNKFEGIVYNEFVYTGTKAYARGVSAVEMQWLEEVLSG